MKVAAWQCVDPNGIPAGIITEDPTVADVWYNKGITVRTFWVDEGQTTKRCIWNGGICTRRGCIARNQCDAMSLHNGT